MNALVPSVEIMLIPLVTSKRPQIDASMYFAYKSLFPKNVDIEWLISVIIPVFITDYRKENNISSN